jgi:crotonobetainyl-CoA:carnitine CoA-transferase CaiB-like acyl-CoA transferase
MPSRHRRLGLDHDTLRAQRDDLIWCCISAMGLEHGDVPGYDPVLQALCGYMDLTGHPDGPPLQCGPPLIDLKAGDEAFTQVIHSLWERSETGQGRRIDISMAQCAVSWLHTFLPMLDMGSPPEEVRRNGNKHRQFIPVNSYPTRDGYVYVAIGSDAQWARFVKTAMFAALDEERFRTNESRRREQDDLHALIGAVTSKHTVAEVSAALGDATIPHSPITPIEGVADLDFVRASALQTCTPDGRAIRLPPPAVATAHLEEIGRELPFSPSYGQDTDAVFTEVGLDAGEIGRLRESGVIA